MTFEARARCFLVACMLGAVLSAGCKPSVAKPTGTVELTVFAASSLTEAFEELARGFQRSHPEVGVQLSFAGSQVLRLQIEQGASADLFASANESHMEALVDEGLVSEPESFAQNELVVIVPAANPAGIETFEQLDRALRIVIGNPNAPLGIYTQALFGQARAQLGDRFADTVRDHVVSSESNARLVRAKVVMGEADAAVVYLTDAASSKGIRVVPIPDELNVSASYFIGSVVSSGNPAEASQLVRYVMSENGRQTLRRHGFVTEAP